VTLVTDFTEPYSYSSSHHIRIVTHNTMAAVLIKRFALLALTISPIMAVPLDVAFKRFSNLDCTGEVRSVHTKNFDKLHNPKCKTWEGEPFYSFEALQTGVKESDKLRKGAEICRIYSYALPLCESRGESTPESAVQSFGRCITLDNRAGAMSVEIRC